MKTKSKGRLPSCFWKNKLKRGINMNQDYIVRAMAANHQLRIFAVSSKNLVERARQIHGTSPVATAALGRLLTAGSMMGSMMKGDKDILTLQIQCGGPIGGLTVTADSKANVKGYVKQPVVILPPNAQGKLDVSGAIGPGFLNVIRDIGLKEPYNGQTHLVSGGFIIQVMPFAEDSVIDKVEASLKHVHSVTDLLEQGMLPEDIIRHLMGNLDIDILDKIPAGYVCNCSKERVSGAIASIGRADLQEMIDSGETIEVNCHFCGSHYYFTTDELRKFLI